MGMPFDCNKCGLCCRLVKLIDPNWPTRADGACIHLMADNRCEVYVTRPRICRVDESLPPGVTVEVWHEVNAEVCKELQDADSRPPPAGPQDP
jgi:Fe-S-cluster containining protein